MARLLCDVDHDEEREMRRMELLAAQPEIELSLSDEEEEYTSHLAAQAAAAPPPPSSSYLDQWKNKRKNIFDDNAMNS